MTGLSFQKSRRNSSINEKPLTGKSYAILSTPIGFLIFSILLANLSIGEAVDTLPLHHFSIFFLGSRRPVDAAKARQIRYRHLALFVGIKQNVSLTTCKGLVIARKRDV